MIKILKLVEVTIIAFAIYYTINTRATYTQLAKDSKTPQIRFYACVCYLATSILLILYLCVLFIIVLL